MKTDIAFCGMCCDTYRVIDPPKVTAEFGWLCPRCADRYRAAQSDNHNGRDPRGAQTHRIQSCIQVATLNLVQAASLAETVDAYALEGEILTVLAALENVSGQRRRRNSARQFPSDDKYD